MKKLKAIVLALIGVAIISFTGCGTDEDHEIRVEDVKFKKSLTWDFSDSSIIVGKSGSGTSVDSLTLKDNKSNKEYVFECNNCRFEDGMLFVDEGGYITSLTEIGRVGKIGIKFNQDYGINYVEVKNGYSLDKASLVASKKDLLWGPGIWYDTEGEGIMQGLAGLPNFVEIANAGGILAINSITIEYDGVTTELVRADFDTNFYGFLIEGDHYNPGNEVFSKEEGIFTFYLIVSPDSPYIDPSPSTPLGIIDGIPTEWFETGDIIRADGSRKSKTEPLEIGDAIEVFAGQYTFNVELPVKRAFTANNLKELMPYNTSNSIGDVNILVVPLYFGDQKEYATDNYKKELCSYLGRVISDDGSITEYHSQDIDYTFTEYFDLSSYGKLNLNCFVTDFYQLEGTFEENSEMYLPDYVETIDEIQKWVSKEYSGMLDKLDADDDGIFDAVIFVIAPGNNQDSYITLSFQGAFNHTMTYWNDRADTSGKGAAINYYVSMNGRFFKDIYSTGYTSGTLCHEFSHQLGLIDYYDVTYYGINAVGEYDMQSSDYGDWNAFSKFCAGWNNPIVVDPKDIDKGVEITIDAFEKDGSAIVIPTSKTTIAEDGTISPFSEYMLVDLFTPEGLYLNSCFRYGLTDPGVRIYHVDGREITIELTSDSGEDYQVGTSICTNAYNEEGLYHLELIQKSGLNTFTDFVNLNPVISYDDLFYEGDSFSMAKHSSFFVDGKMDDGSSLDYTITVKSIENGKATIRISK